MKAFNKIDPKELARQLKQPTGELGKFIGLKMNEGNKEICLNTYRELAPKKGTKVLEIGMGNGYYIKQLLQQVANIKYYGLDYSSTMLEEALKINAPLLATGQVEFINSSLDQLPFKTDYFEYICSTNTIYFWPDPEENIKEIGRVLKSEGKLLLAYREKSYLDSYDIFDDNFKKYEIKEIEELLLSNGFQDVQTKSIKERLKKQFNGEVLAKVGLYTTGIRRQ